jgi:hypothetical protein
MRKLNTRTRRSLWNLPTLLFSAAALMSILVPLAAASANDAYNGDWWLSVNERQRKGFVHGFVLCYSQLADHQLFQESYAAYSTRLQEYLREHAQQSSESMNVLLLRMAAPPYARPVRRTRSEGNDTPKQLDAKWGAHEDADDWRAGRDWDLGYIQGFLECYAKDTKSKYGTFSRPADWYVKAISDWYGIKDDDPDSIDAKREKDKIPEVLFHFRDTGAETRNQ